MPTVEELAALPVAELESRMAVELGRIEERVARATAENRDMTAREFGLSESNRRQLALLGEAIELRESRDADGSHRSQLVQRAADRHAIEHRSGELGEFVTALQHRLPYRGTVETRSVTTANAGARGAVAAGSIGTPEWLWTAAGIPFHVADSLKVSGPKFAALVARGATAELGTKPNQADPSLEEETLAAFAIVEEVSDQVARFGVGAQVIADRLGAEVVFSVNAAFADALEAAAGTPIEFVGTPSGMADLAIAKTWAKTGAKPTALLVNSSDYPKLSEKAAVGPGDGIAAPVVAFNGTPLVVNDAIGAGVAVAVVGYGFSAHGTGVEFASMPSLTNNVIVLRAEVYAALLQHDAGAAVAVELV